MAGKLAAVVSEREFVEERAKPLERIGCIELKLWSVVGEMQASARS